MTADERAPHNEIVIRPATGQDVRAINEIYNYYVVNSVATFRTSLQSVEQARQFCEEIWEGAYPFLVAEIDGQVVGWAALKQYGAREVSRYSVVDSIYIGNEYTGRGIGRKLLGQLIEDARRGGYHTIVARISDHNESSVKLHEKLGFFIVGELREVGWQDHRWIDLTIMQIILD